MFLAELTTSEGGRESAVYHVCLPRFVVEGGRYVIYGSLYQVTTFPGVSVEKKGGKNVVENQH